MKRVAIFISKYSINNSPSILNLIDLLERNNCLVDIYIKEVWLLGRQLLDRASVRIFDFTNKVSISTKIKITLKGYSKFYSAYIAIDPHGFVLCKQLFPRSKPIYYSLELYMSDDHFGLDYSDEISIIERAKISEIKGLIIQSEEKESLFREDYKLSDTIPALILPVCYWGKSIKDKSEFLYDKYNIPRSKKIAIHLGGIAEWYKCKELAVEFGHLSGWVLFFQGYARHDYIEKLRQTIELNSLSNVIITDIEYETIDEVYPLLMSSTVGIAWYENLSVGFRTVGQSSGKIAAYLKFGLPVVTNKYPSTIKTIENLRSGVCIATVSEIGGALDNITSNYWEYSVNAAKTYDSLFCFDNYTIGLGDFMNIKTK